MFQNDYQNAFNRDLMLKLCEAHTPQIKNLVNWLYTKLVTSEGDVLKSEEGGQQGDGLTNILFGLLQRYIDSKVDFEGLRVKKYFWDDSVFTGNIFGVVSALQKIRSMQVEIGLPVRFNKIHFHCPSPEIAAECARRLAESGIPIKKPASDGEEGGGRGRRGGSLIDGPDLDENPDRVKRIRAGLFEKEAF